MLHYPCFPTLLQAHSELMLVDCSPHSPMDRPHGRIGAGNQAAPGAPAGMPHVLIIDDDSVGLDLLGRFFTADGFHVSLAATGRDGLSFATQRNIDLLVLDLYLPDMSGVAVLAELRQAGRGLPVVVVSGFGTLEEAAAAMKLGAIDVLSKPLDAEDLVAIARSLVVRAPAVERSIRPTAPPAPSAPDGDRCETWTEANKTAALTPDERLFASARDVIDAHVSDADLDLATVATALGVSRWRLSRTFSACNADFRSCVRDARITRAGRRFREHGAGSVKEVAIDSGYRNVSDFIRHFKAHWGMTPGAFRSKGSERPEKE